MLFFYIIAPVIILVINYIAARKFESIAIDKGYTPEDDHPFAMCFWLGIIGYLYVCAMPDKKLQTTQRELCEAVRYNKEQQSSEISKEKIYDDELPEL